MGRSQDHKPLIMASLGSGEKPANGISTALTAKLMCNIRMQVHVYIYMSGFYTRFFVGGGEEINYQ